MEIQQRAPLPSSRTFPPFSMFFSRSRRSTVTTLTSCFKRIAWNDIYIYIYVIQYRYRGFIREKYKICCCIGLSIVGIWRECDCFLWFRNDRRFVFLFFFFCRIMNRGNNFPWFGVNVAFFFCLWFWNIYSFVDYR